MWGDAVEGASEAYKDQIKFDLAYFNNSIWNKFQSIANSNTAEFIAFEVLMLRMRKKLQCITNNEKYTRNTPNFIILLKPIILK